MRTLSFVKYVFTFLCTIQAVKADLTPEKLDQAKAAGAPEYTSGSEAFAEAISFSTMQNQSRTKLPGTGKIYLEGGFQVFDVNDKALYTFTDNLHCPASFQTILLQHASTSAQIGGILTAPYKWYDNMQ